MKPRPAPRPTQPAIQPRTIITGYFPGVKRPEHGVDHPSPSAGLQFVWRCTSTSPLCLHRHVMLRPLPYRHIERMEVHGRSVQLG